MLDVLLIGSNGQLGKTLKNLAPKHFNLVSLDKSRFNLENIDPCINIIEKYKPKWLINAAAYTNVEKAENEINTAYKINSVVPGIISERVNMYGGNFLHVSTDYVFDGYQKIPYKIDSVTNPLNIYGKSKLEGEKRVLEFPNSFVIRTSWLYGDSGKNFFLKMIDLQKSYSKNNKPIKVISDQFGCPTYTESLSEIIWELIKKAEDYNFQKNIPNLLHWSDYGKASWYDFAKLIREISLKNRLINNSAEIIPISSTEYPSKCVRPSYSVLDSSLTSNLLGIKQKTWEENLLKAVLHKIEGKKCAG